MNKPCIVFNPAEIYQKECTSNVMQSFIAYHCVSVCVLLYSFFFFASAAATELGMYL